MSDADAVIDVLEAIAAAEGVAPHELEYSLYEFVHPTALKSLVGMDDAEWVLTFQVPDHEVTVDSDGAIRVDGVLERRIGSPGVGRRR